MATTVKCTICNNKYEICNTCKSQKIFKPWRTVTDTIEHYKIYLAIHSYTVSNNKEFAKEELQKCNLTGLEINEIMGTPVKVKTSSRKRKEYAEVENEENGISE